MIESGTTLDRYECLHPIGKGGMATVWVARLVGKHGFEKLVAIKTTLPQHAGDPEFLKMLLDEAHIVSGIQHPNVASVLDLGEQDGQFYLVFEWVEGEQLSKVHKALVKRRKSLPVGVALRIMADVCAGLHAAHELCDSQGWPLFIVHRDVSPQNVMLTVGGDVKIIDFGIAKALDRVAGDTLSGKLKGKTNFMAPEHVRGDEVDRRIDIWAAGVMLYLLIANRFPMKAEKSFDLLRMLANYEEPDPLPPTVPQQAAAVVMKALRPSRDERYQTAAEMQRDLEQAIVEVAGAVTAADVAALVRGCVGDRIDAKRTAIGEALDHAVSRSQAGKHRAARDALKSIADTEAISEVGTHPGSSESHKAESKPSLESELPAAEGSFTSLRPSSSHNGQYDSPTVEPDDIGQVGEPSPPAGRNRWLTSRWAITSALGGSALVGIVLVSLGTRSGRSQLVPAQHVPLGAPTSLVDVVAQRAAASAAASAAPPPSVLAPGSNSAPTASSVSPPPVRRPPREAPKRKDPLSVFGTR